MRKKKIPNSRHNIPYILFMAGRMLVGCSLLILLLSYGPFLREELGYTVRHARKIERTTVITPVSYDFGIVIPKIGANARIIPDVDPFDSTVYQRALTRGVAHAKGSGLPGQGKNTFLFSHSSVDFYNALRYNSVFYLLTKLETGDTIDIYYRNIRYTYSVVDIRKVANSAVQYLYTVPQTETVTLMTCWPPGTSYQRLLVIAKRQP